MDHPHKTCRQCGETKSILGFYAGKGYTGGRKSTCKACHSAKYSRSAGYISPRDAAAKKAADERTKHCDYCGNDIPRSKWPRDASGHLKPRCAGCMEAYRAPKQKKGRTPEQRAQYRRSRGETKADYMPRHVTVALAEARRASRHDAHVGVLKRHTSLQDRRQAKLAQHDAHVRLFRNGTHDWRLRYKTDSEFTIKERLRTQLRKKAKLHPKLDDLMRAAINRRGESQTVEVVCGYRIADLMRHLERQFTAGMDWAAFSRGEIHIDHKRPQASFDLTDEHQVRACWALTNLQPLWARDNLAKGAKWAA